MSCLAKGLVLAALLTASHAAAAQSVPPALQNKSAIVSWHESRTQRNVGEERTETVAVPYTYRVYFSTAGRPFARLTVANQRGVTASAERVGTGTKTVEGGVRSVQIQGRSLVSTATYAGGARRIQVNFDGGFSSCSAQVVLGKSGGGSIVMTNLVTKKKMEVLSSTASAASCSLQAGNVFGN